MMTQASGRQVKPRWTRVNQTLYFPDRGNDIATVLFFELLNISAFDELVFSLLSIALCKCLIIVGGWFDLAFYIYIYIYILVCCLVFYTGCMFLCSNRTLHLGSRVLGMTLNCIWWRGTSYGTLGNVEYPFIAITPRSTLTRSGSTC